MAVFVTGDTHGLYCDTKKLYQGKFSNIAKGLTKDDVVIVLGDFGWCFNATRTGVEANEERRALNHFQKLPYTLLFIDGNHENFDRLCKYPEAEAYGGKVGILRPNVLHLKERGHIYDINGLKCWCFGGAYSTDIVSNNRKEGISWWRQEIPTQEEYDRGLNELDNAGWKVDLALTHDAPQKIGKLIWGPNLHKDPLSEYLDRVSDRIDCQRWYFGHHHVDVCYRVDNKDYCGLYGNIVAYDEPIITRRTDE